MPVVQPPEPPGGGLTDPTTCQFGLAANFADWKDTGITLAANESMLIWGAGNATFDGTNATTPDGSATFPDGGGGWIDSQAIALNRIPYSLVVYVGASNPGFGVAAASTYQSGRSGVIVNGPGKVYVAYNDRAGTFGDNTGGYCVYFGGKVTNPNFCTLGLPATLDNWFDTGVTLAPGQVANVYGSGIATFDGKNVTTPDGAIGTSYENGGSGWDENFVWATGKKPFSLVWAISAANPGAQASGSHIFQGGTTPLNISTPGGGKIWALYNDRRGAYGDDAGTTENDANTGGYCLSIVPNPNVPYLDNFDGAKGTDLLLHPADTLQTYSLLTSLQQSPNLVLDGSGRLKRAAKTLDVGSQTTDAYYLASATTIPATCVWSTKITVKGPVCSKTEGSILTGVFGYSFDADVNNGPLTVHYNIPLRAWIVLVNKCVQYPNGLTIFNYADDFKNWSSSSKQFDIGYTYANGYATLTYWLDGVQIGSYTQIANGSFESGAMPDWTIGNLGDTGNIAVINDGNADTGNYAVKFVPAANNAATLMTYNPVLPGGRNYTITYRAKGLIAGAGLGLRIICNSVLVNNLNIGTTYKTYSTTFTPGVGSGQVALVRANNATTYYIDNVTLRDDTTGTMLLTPGLPMAYHTGRLGVIAQDDLMYRRNAGVRLCGLACHTLAPGSTIFSNEGSYPDGIRSCDNWFFANHAQNVNIRR